MRRHSGLAQGAGGGDREQESLLSPTAFSLTTEVINKILYMQSFNAIYNKINMEFSLPAAAPSAAPSAASQPLPIPLSLPWLNNKGAQLDLTLAQSHRSPSQNGFCRRRRRRRPLCAGPEL